MQNTNSVQSENLSNVIKINEAQIQDHPGEIVRSTVEETLNAMLDAETDQLCGARRYERSGQRTNGRTGHYKRIPQTQPEHSENFSFSAQHLPNKPTE